MRRALLAMLIVGVSCTGPAIRVAAPLSPSTQPDAPSSQPTGAPGTTMVSDALTAEFDRNDLVGPIQSASVWLVHTVHGSADLDVSPLHSPSNEAAVEVKEIDRGAERWGRLMIPAERRIIATFARNAALGRWLVIVDDVRVTNGPDPVPLTGYRWTRADVESYARCGIPTRAIDTCTSDFYTKSQMWLMPVGSKPLGG